MRVRVGSVLEYQARLPSTLILNIQVPNTPGQVVLADSLVVDPDIRMEAIPVQAGGNRFVRLVLPPDRTIRIAYQATVETTYQVIDPSQLTDVPMMQMDGDVIPYLFPSRYCQSDRLYRMAFQEFGWIENAYAKVLALTDWIYRHVEYLTGSTNAQTSACDTMTERAGVCRDFAHLGIALCRALTIPARYVTSYAYQVEPADFHACFEAYLGGQWILFDATRRAPLNGLVRIATGRDAADVAVASIFGDVDCPFMEVRCEVLDQAFVPFDANASSLKGLAYQ